MEFNKFGKYFVLIFMFSYLVINWNEVSWIFNCRAVSGIVSNIFQKEESNEEVIASSNEEIKNEESKKIEELDYSEKENSIEIPKIEISAPLIFVENSNENDIHQALDRGVVHFPNSVLPGEAGQTVILGHSAPPGWPKIKYDWVFSDLNKMENGDEVLVYFNHKKYTFYVVKKIFLERGEEISKDSLTNSDSVLILISCWPPGKDLKRIAVEAKLKE